MTNQLTTTVNTAANQGLLASRWAAMREKERERTVDPEMLTEVEHRKIARRIMTLMADGRERTPGDVARDLGITEGKAKAVLKHMAGADGGLTVDHRPCIPIYMERNAKLEQKRAEAALAGQARADAGKEFKNLKEQVAHMINSGMYRADIEKALDKPASTIASAIFRGRRDGLTINEKKPPSVADRCRELWEGGTPLQEVHKIVGCKHITVIKAIREV